MLDKQTSGARAADEGADPETPSWAQSFALTLAYAALAVLSHFLFDPAAGVAPLWPPAGLAVGALLVLGGRRCWAGVWLGEFLARALLPFLDPALASPPWSALGIAILLGGGASVQAAACVRITRVRLRAHPGSLPRRDEAFRVLLVAGPVAAAIGTLIAVGALVAFGRLAPNQIVSTGVLWWAANVGGIVLFAPFALLAMPEPGNDRDLRERNAHLEGELRRLTGSLERSKKLSNEIFEFAPDAIVMTDRTGRIAMVNNQAVQLFGWPRDELIGQPVERLMPVASGAKHAELRQHYFANAVPRAMGADRSNLKAVRMDGTEFPAEISLSPMETETGPMVAAAVRDVSQRKDAERAARQALATLDATEDGAFIFSPDTLLFSFVNEGAVRQVGYSRAELLTMTPLDLKPKFTVQSFRDMLEPLRTGQVRNLPFTTDHRHKDGHTIPVEINLQFVAPVAEQARYIAIARDVTERIKAQESVVKALREKEVLLKEIHHRVKNNLQIISSMLALQSDLVDETTRQFLIDSQHRVRAMAMIHEKLYQTTNLGRVDFADYVQSLAEFLLRSFSRGNGHVALQVQADPVSLNIDTALPCGLILNELITNALKHAFSDGRQGELRVELRGEDGQYNLIVEDNGAGLPADFRVHSVDTLGLQLVNTLARQLKGTLSISGEQGARFRLDFKELVYAPRN